MAPVYLSVGQYGCPYCTKVMKQSSDIRRHILIHTGEKPFRCSICGHKTNHKGSLKLHIQKYHSK